MGTVKFAVQEIVGTANMKCPCGKILKDDDLLGAGRFIQCKHHTAKHYPEHWVYWDKVIK